MNILLRNSLIALSTTTLAIAVVIASAGASLALSAPIAGDLTLEPSERVMSLANSSSETLTDSLSGQNTPPSNGNGTAGSEPAGTRGRG